MISGLLVPKVSLAGSTTPTDLWLPSAVTKLWLTHFPSKYTLAAVCNSTPEYFSVMLMKIPLFDAEITLDKRLGDEAEEAQTKRNEHPDRAVLACLGLP